MFKSMNYIHMTNVHLLFVYDINSSLSFELTKKTCIFTKLLRMTLLKAGLCLQTLKGDFVLF